MALQTSGAISLDDIHVELDATSGTTVSINDSDVRGLIDKADGATSAFNEFYGASNVTYVAATGGATTTSGNYKYHYFNSSGTLSFSEIGTGGASNVVDYIIIAGGGSGGKGYWNYSTQYINWTGGGGGAGGYRVGTFNASVGNKSITVGAGGAGVSSGAYTNMTRNGNNSSIEGVASATRGGGGGYLHYYYSSVSYMAVGGQVKGWSGGSGGGNMLMYFGGNITEDGVLNTNANMDVGGSGVSGQGHAGSRGVRTSAYNAGYAGSGGGKGGSPPAATGTMSAPSSYPNINYKQDGGPGSNTGAANYNNATRGGGGGGMIWAWYSSQNTGLHSDGGSGGGGRGAKSRNGQSGGNYSSATSGTANTGGGGGGGGYTQSSGAGGSGIVMIRYQYQG